MYKSYRYPKCYDGDEIKIEFDSMHDASAFDTAVDLVNKAVGPDRRAQTGSTLRVEFPSTLVCQITNEYYSHIEKVCGVRNLKNDGPRAMTMEVVPIVISANDFMTGLNKRLNAIESSMSASTLPKDRAFMTMLGELRQDKYTGQFIDVLELVAGLMEIAIPPNKG